MDANETTDKLIDFIKDAKIGYLSTLTPEGDIVSRPLGIPQKEYVDCIWLMTNRNSNKVRQITTNPNVNLSFSADNAWVSISAHAESTYDKYMIEKLWSPMNETFFDGPEDPNICLLKLTPTGAEYWDMSSGKMTNLLKMVSSAVTGKKNDVGENESIQLDTDVK